MIFLNRADAGRRLAKKLGAYARRKDVIVLGIPRGGVLVAFQVAAELEVPLDAFVARKLGVPGHEELAFGAIAPGGIRVLDDQIVEDAGISDLEVELIAAMERQELDRRDRVYRGRRPPLNLAGKTVILVDDGIATGASIRAALIALKQLKPTSIVLAVPIALASACVRIRPEVDDLVCLHTPETLDAIGKFYADFSQGSDEDVTTLLERNDEQRDHCVAIKRRNIRKGVHT